MSKHTPGPWGISINPDEPEIVAQLCTSGLAYFAIVPSDSVSLGDIVADARLIAAAPELLEAARLVLAWHDAEADFSGTTFWQRVDMCRESEAALRAAVTKATGVEQ